MKKKEIISIIIIAIVLTAMLAGCLYLANRHRSDVREKKTTVIINSMYQIHGQYIYFNYDGKLLRFDTESDTLVKLCADSKCDGECILENAGYTSRIYKNRFYFSFNGNNHGIAYYDTETGKTQIIKKIIEPVYSEFFVYDDDIYYIRDPQNDDTNTLYRFSADGGKEKVIIELELDERLIMVADGMIFTEKTVIDKNYESPIGYSTLYAYDVLNLERREIWSSDRNKYNVIGSRAQFYDGYLYFEIRIIDESTTEAGSYYLYRADPRSREVI